MSKRFLYRPANESRPRSGARIINKIRFLPNEVKEVTSEELESLKGSPEFNNLCKRKSIIEVGKDYVAEPEVVTEEAEEEAPKKPSSVRVRKPESSTAEKKKEETTGN